jgi:hypothetical protein
MISSRHAPWVAVLLAVALVPTAIHSYWGATAADALKASAIPAMLDGMPSVPTERRAAWVKNTLGSEDWIERTYRVDGAEVLVFVGRSYDAKRLYHHPELALLRGTETGPAGVARAPARPDVPLHLLTTKRDGAQGLAAYALLYDGRFVEDPIAFQLRTSAELLVGGRKPMTLFLASDLRGDVTQPEKAPATRVLLGAIRAFETQATAAAGE